MTPDVSRRSFLAGAAALALAACSSGGKGAASSSGGSVSSSSGTSSASSATSSSGSPSGATVPTTAAPGGPARFVSAGPTGRNEVALTFHTNGDLGLYHQLVDILAAHKVVITAFIVGNWLHDNPELGKALHAAGHELANHTYTHPTFLTLGAKAQQDEIARCRAELAAAGEEGGGRLFRISGTDDGLAVPPASVLSLIGAAGYPTALGFDVDPFDYQDPGADAVAQRTIAKLHDGAIVSLHFGHSGTVAALPRILDAVASKGLTPVTASKLLA